MIDGKQFIIAEDSYYAENFASTKLSCGLILSAHKDLEVYIDPTKRGILLGYAWQAVCDRSSPEESLETLLSHGSPTRQDIFEMEKTWCGRYVLIIDDVLYLDACGMLGVYYGKGCVSSSMHLLNEHLRLNADPLVTWPYLNWLPAPLTHIKGIKRLLSSQLLNILSLEIEPRQLVLAVGQSNVSNEVKAQEFIEIFSNSLKNLFDRFPKKDFCLAVTGGYDSRTILAVMQGSNTPFRCYTIEHEYMNEGDFYTPVELCKALGVEHTYVPISQNSYSKKTDSEYITHTFGYSNDKDRAFIARGQYDELVRGRDVVCIRGSIWECVIDYYNRYTSSGLFNRKATLDELFATKNKLVCDSIAEYDKWTSQNKQNFVSDSDRFLWEQREGCWLSGIEQGFDYCEHIISVQPMNCRYLLALLYRFDADMRKSKSHQELIVNIAAPALSSISYGGEKLVKGSLKNFKFKKFLDRLRLIGLTGTFGIYWRMLKRQK